ncbi:hypothetical protein KAR91_33730 [Candidatus Pacearchaeota archaeon]|nr:hypothetical protein [Candidatus Pacearchaeota archaeon]
MSANTAAGFQHILINANDMIVLIANGATILPHPSTATHFCNVKKDGQEYKLYVRAR